MEEKRDVAYRRGARGGRDSGGRGRRCRSGGAPPAHRARGGAEEDLQRWRPDVLSRSITGLVLHPLYQRSSRTARSDSEPCAAGSGFVGLECSRRRDPRCWWGPPRCCVGSGVRKPRPQRSPRTPGSGRDMGARVQITS
jgi:hypothetical protein